MKQRIYYIGVILLAIGIMTLTFSLFFLPLTKVSAQSSTMWDKTYGGTERDRGPSLVVTSDGGYAITGYTTSFGAGSSDWWLVKTDASGDKMWS